MRRRNVWQVLWRASFATLPPESRIAIAGAGISGLNLAYALARQGVHVTVYDPALRGGVRIPLMHACALRTPGSALWQEARRFAANWYCRHEFASAVIKREGPSGVYFSIHTRRYLALLRALASGVGVQFAQSAIPDGLELPLFIAMGIGTLKKAQPIWKDALLPLPGFESYFALRTESQLPPEALTQSSVRSNYFVHARRAAFIHRNGSERQVAIDFARALHATERHALCYGVRLASRDRLPVVGYALPPEFVNFDTVRTIAVKNKIGDFFPEKQKVFFFTGMGYHAMTYAPFLADRVALWLTGRAQKDENLLGALTPARFLPP